jgi:anti-sigma regulatory factor (Ser/Thr protein kinase)
MPRKSRQNPDIHQFILQNVATHPRDIATRTADHFGTTRVTANRYLTKLVDEGLLTASGIKKGRTYKLRQLVSQDFRFPVHRKLEEHVIYDETVGPLLRDLPENVRDICQYGFNEMMNNVIDHSESDWCTVSFVRNAVRVDIMIQDYGVGIFRKIQRECNLSDPRHALLELSKGKLTTDPERHSGEGIFFTSRMFTEFAISSGDLYYSRTLRDDDEWLIESSDNFEPMPGTGIRLQLDADTEYTVAEVFRRYESAEDEPPRGFSRTHVPVRLARYKRAECWPGLSASRKCF